MNNPKIVVCLNSNIVTTLILLFLKQTVTGMFRFLFGIPPLDTCTLSKELATYFLLLYSYSTL